MTYPTQFAPRFYRQSATQSKTVHLSLGLAAILGLWPSLAQAQVQVTGGDLSFTNTEIFVPNPACGCNSGSPAPAMFTGVGSTPSSFFIQTAQGNTVLNAIFRTDINPLLSTAPGAVPAAGDTTLRGGLKGSLSFRGFTASGEPAYYDNIPTQLDFQVTGGTFTQLRESDRYTTDRLFFTRTGIISNPDATVTVTDPVVLIQFPSRGQGPSDQLIDGIPVSASFYDNDQGAGIIYDSTFDAKITGGEVTTPTLPDFSFAMPTNPKPITDGNGPGDAPPPVLGIPGFTSEPTTVLPGVGEGQTDPVMPAPGSNWIAIGIFFFPIVPSGLWYDPPTAEAFDFTMKPSPQRVGVASRVFPGFGGTREETSTFTAITGLPKGIDKDETFTVSVKGVTLGDFTSDQTVRFSDYKEKLGALWRDGGVESFTVSGIDGGVDPKNPRAFPIRLQFNTPTASFEMKAQGVQTAGAKAAPVARMMLTPKG